MTVTEETQTMDPTVKQLWLDELRSGEYQQGKGNLRAIVDGTEGFCCLGVLCNIVQPSKWSAPLPSGVRLHNDTDGMPSGSVINTSGLSLLDAQHLAAMNDSGESFEMIAEWIERNL